MLQRLWPAPCCSKIGRAIPGDDFQKTQTPPDSKCLSLSRQSCVEFASQNWPAIDSKFLQRNRSVERVMSHGSNRQATRPKGVTIISRGSKVVYWQPIKSSIRRRASPFACGSLRSNSQYSVLFLRCAELCRRSSVNRSGLKDQTLLTGEKPAANLLTSRPAARPYRFR